MKLADEVVPDEVVQEAKGVGGLRCGRERGVHCPALRPECTSTQPPEVSEVEEEVVVVARLPSQRIEVSPPRSGSGRSGSGGRGGRGG